MGGEVNEKKLHLVRWSDICQPKENGGLSIRSLNENNAAFLMKLCWNLISNSDALRVKILRGKYMNTQSLIPTMLILRNGSHLWKSICRDRYS